MKIHYFKRCPLSKSNIFLSEFKPGGIGCCPFSGGGSVVVDFLFIVTPIVGVCNCSMFCGTLLYVHSSIAIILMGKRELIALINLSSWCLVIVERLFLPVPRGCLQFVIVVFPDHTHLLFLMKLCHSVKYRDVFFKLDNGPYCTMLSAVMALCL